MRDTFHLTGGGGEGQLAKLLTSAPALNAGISAFEAWQATIPASYLHNQQIDSLIREQTESALGGAFQVVNVTTTGFSPPGLTATPSIPDWSGPPPPEVMTEAVWVPNGYELSSKPAAGGSHWSADIMYSSGSSAATSSDSGSTPGPNCGFVLTLAIAITAVSVFQPNAAPLAVGAWIAWGASCSNTLNSESNSLSTQTQQQMDATLNDVMGFSDPTAQNYTDASNYTMDGSNDIIPNYGVSGDQQYIDFTDGATTQAYISNTDPTGDWGNSDQFLQTGGAFAGGDGFGFQGSFTQAFGDTFRSSQTNAQNGGLSRGLASDMVREEILPPELLAGSSVVTVDPSAHFASGAADITSNSSLIGRSGFGGDAAHGFPGGVF